MYSEIVVVGRGIKLVMLLWHKTFSQMRCSDLINLLYHASLLVLILETLGELGVGLVGDNG